MTKHHSSFYEFKGNEFRFDIYPCEEMPEDKEYTQVYAIVLNKEKDSILCAQSKYGQWVLPGGTIEDGETLLETLIREVLEESNRTLQLDTLEPLFFQDTFKKCEEGWKYNGTQTRFMAVVDEDRKFVEDPDEGKIVKVEWVKIDNITDYLEWGETGPFLVNLLKERLSL